MQKILNLKSKLEKQPTCLYEVFPVRGVLVLGGLLVYVMKPSRVCVL